MKLKAGEEEYPASYYKLKKENDYLKAQLEALKTRGMDLLKDQLEIFFKNNGLLDSSDILKKLTADNNELRRMMQELLAKGLTIGPG